MKTLFLDESGTHELKRIQPDYPIFVLAGVICDADYARGELERRVRRFKLDLFGTSDIVLHTADIVRSKNGFQRLQEQPFREQFYRGLNQLMRELEYSVVACAIKKPEYVARYGPRAADP
jgi:nicotinamide riboside kinase